MQKRVAFSYLTTISVLLIVFGWAFVVGPSQQGIPQTWQTLVSGHQTTYFNTLINIRLPRIVATLISGAMLAIAGTFFQATLRNSIADPSILGVAAGADLFTMFGSFIVPSLLFKNFVFALIGGLIALFVLVQFHSITNPYQLILIGVALNTMFVGIKTLFIQPNVQLTTANFSTITWTTTMPLLILGMIGLMLSIIVSPWANYLKIGDTQLSTLGLPVAQIRFVLLALSVYLTSCVTAGAGVIPFIGIIVPHISRGLVGHDYREVVPFATLLGATLLLLIDTIGRVIIMPNEIAAVTLLAIIGGPTLIFILARRGIYNGN